MLSDSFSILGAHFYINRSIVKHMNLVQGSSTFTFSHPINQPLEPVGGTVWGVKAL